VLVSTTVTDGDVVMIVPDVEVLLNWKITVSSPSDDRSANNVLVTVPLDSKITKLPELMFLLRFVGKGGYI
jgi:hypothetical protein